MPGKTIAGKNIGFGIDVSDVDIKRIRTKLALIGWKLADNSGWLQQTADDVIYPRLRMVFDSGGKPKWTGLSKSYNKPSGLPILVLSGDLQRSMTRKGSIGSHFILNKKRLEVGSDARTRSGYTLSMLHQTGTSKMPARKIFSTMTTKFIFDGARRIFRRHARKINKDFWQTRIPPFGGK